MLRSILLTSSLFFLFLFSFAHSLQSQVSFKAVYGFHEYGPYVQKDTLSYSGGIARYVRQRDYQEHKADEATFYYYAQDYEWYLDVQKRAIQEFRRIDQNIPLYAKCNANFEWEITQEQKQIGDYVAQKAIAKRVYDEYGSGDWDPGHAIAWFATEIPVGIGPARYYGLPGLIIELSFAKRGIKYALEDIIFSNEASPIAIPEKEGVEVTEAEIIRPFLIDKKWLKKEKARLKAAN